MLNILLGVIIGILITLVNFILIKNQEQIKKDFKLLINNKKAKVIDLSEIDLEKELENE